MEKYVADPPRVKGGVRTNPYDNEVRTDNVGHVLMAVCKLILAEGKN